MNGTTRVFVDGIGFFFAGVQEFHRTDLDSDGEERLAFITGCSRYRGCPAGGFVTGISSASDSPEASESDRPHSAGKVFFGEKGELVAVFDAVSKERLDPVGLAEEAAADRNFAILGPLGMIRELGATEELSLESLCTGKNGERVTVHPHPGLP